MIGLPYAEAIIDADGYAVRCPKCGELCRPAPDARDEDDVTKGANAAYAAHFAAAHDPVDEIAGLIVLEVMAQLEELSDDTVDALRTLSRPEADDPEALALFDRLVAVAEDLRETLIATLDVRVADWRADNAGLLDEPPACRNPRHDHYEATAALADHARTWDPAEVVDRGGEPSVPMRCADCGLPTFYDYTDERYRHLDPDAACFLIQVAGPPASPCEVR